MVKEIDFFITQAIISANRQFISLFKTRIEEHSHFIQKVADTTPGAVYVFDMEQYKNIYSNEKLAEVIGYDENDLNALGENAIVSLVHKEDQQKLRDNLQTLRTANDNEIFITKYRVKTKTGGYKWLANYESVFKRREDGSVWQTIGITLDIDSEQKALEDLGEADRRHKQAEALAHIGYIRMEFFKR